MFRIKESVKSFAVKAVDVVKTGAVKIAAAVAVGSAALLGKAAPAAATLDADVTSLFTAGTDGITGLQAQYLAILVMFIGLAVLGLAYAAVTRGIKKGKGAL